MRSNTGANEERTTNTLANVPLTPGIAEGIIEELFARQIQWKRRDLAVELEAIHVTRGGLKGNQTPQAIAKKALAALLHKGKVENLQALGYWRWKGCARVATSSTLDSKSSPTDRLQTNEASLDGIETPLKSTIVEEQIAAEKHIGQGSESVYVYYFPNDREMAILKGSDAWECKVGRTSANDPSKRVVGQGGRTARAQNPVIALVIRTEDSWALESALHASLRLASKRVHGSPGKEWFMTSPAQIEAWFESYQIALARLKCAKTDTKHGSNDCVARHSEPPQRSGS